MKMRIMTGLALLVLAGAWASGQSTSALLNQALDRQVTLTIDTTLPAALRQISDQTGVRIEADPSIYELLPWGEQTNIKATIQNKTLRESLVAITSRLGLRFELGENAVRLRPVEALARLGRRSTLQELQLLDALATIPFAGETQRPTLRQVVETVDRQLEELKRRTTGQEVVLDFVVETRVASGTVMETIIPVPRGASLAAALEAIAHATAITWYPWGRSVVVLPKEDQIRALLMRPITVRYQGVDISQVLLELSRFVGVPFAIEPGAVQRVPPEFRSVRLIVDNASVQQVLEALSASTGLGYVVTDRGVYIWNNSPIPGAGGAVGGAGGEGQGLRVQVQLADGVQLVIPESELPEELRQRVRARLDEEVRRLGADLAGPATRPADR